MLPGELPGVSAAAHVGSQQQPFHRLGPTEALGALSCPTNMHQVIQSHSGSQEKPHLHLSPGQECAFKPDILTIPIFWCTGRGSTCSELFSDGAELPAAMPQPSAGTQLSGPNYSEISPQKHTQSGHQGSNHFSYTSPALDSLLKQKH